nr:hypothetical protein [Rhizobium sp. P38BS-XIX]
MTDIDANGGKAIAVEADRSDPAQVEGFFPEANRDCGSIDVLVNNCAVYDFWKIKKFCRAKPAQDGAERLRLARAPQRPRQCDRAGLFYTDGSRPSASSSPISARRWRRRQRSGAWARPTGARRHSFSPPTNRAGRPADLPEFET